MTFKFMASVSPEQVGFSKIIYKPGDPVKKIKVIKICTKWCNKIAKYQQSVQVLHEIDLNLHTLGNS